MGKIITYNNSVSKLKTISQGYYNSAEKIEPFLVMLKAYMINGFSYGRIYSDHSTIHLTSDPEFSCYFVEHELFNYAYYSESSQYHNFNYVWNIEDAPNVFLPWKDLTGNKSGITLIRKHSDYCAMSHFSSALAHHEVINFFVNNVSLLEIFTQYFCKTYAALIQKNESCRFKFNSSQNQDLVRSKIDQTSLIKLEDKILLSLKEKDVWLKNQVDYHLSKKERECFQYIIEGYSLKEIANVLFISPRTAEKHVINIKNKLGFKTTRQLISAWNQKFVNL